MTLLTVIILLVIAAGIYYIWITHKPEVDEQGPIVQIDQQESKPEAETQPEVSLQVEDFAASLEQKQIEAPLEQPKRKRSYKKKPKTAKK